MDTILPINDHEWLLEAFLMPALAPTPAAARHSKRLLDCYLRDNRLAADYLFMVQEQAWQLQSGAQVLALDGIRPEFCAYLTELIGWTRQLAGENERTAQLSVPERSLKLEPLVQFFMDLALEEDPEKRELLLNRAVAYIEKAGLSRKEAELAHGLAEERLGISNRN